MTPKWNFSNITSQLDTCRNGKLRFLQNGVRYSQLVVMGVIEVHAASLIGFKVTTRNAVCIYLWILKAFFFDKEDFLTE